METTMSVKIVTGPQVVVNYQESKIENDKIVKVYKTVSLSEFKALENKPKSKSLKVVGIPVSDIEKGEINLNITGYVARVRIVRPKAGDTWSEFVDCTLVKDEDEDLQALLDELF